MSHADFKIVGFDVYLGRQIPEVAGRAGDAILRCHGKLGEELDVCFLTQGATAPANTSQNAATASGTLYVDRDTFPWYVEALHHGYCIAHLDFSLPANNRLSFSGEPGRPA
jgi:hypothetical protein